MGAWVWVGREMGPASGEKRDVATRKSVSKALRAAGDLVDRRRRRMGERWPVTSARNTSLSFASSRVMFQPTGMPFATE